MISNMICFFFTIIIPSGVMGYEGRDIEVYTTLLSGHFSNAKSLSGLRKGGIVTAQNNIELYMFPINYPALNSEIVLFFYELKDGNVTRQVYAALNQSGPVIQVDMYNVARSNLLNLSTLDVSELESLSTDDLHTAPDCKTYITRIGETLFNAEYGNCHVDGFTSAKYKATHSCDIQTYYIDSIEFPENKSKLPYMFNKLESYPIPASIFPDYDKYKAMCG